jgi:ParB family transcriptional regulator, chromosome partitioning protein
VTKTVSRNLGGRPCIFKLPMTAAQRQARRRKKLAKRRFRLKSTSNYEWFTPAALIANVRAVLGGIDVDPASCAIANETVGAKVFYTLADDGLSQQWFGRLFLNPPFCQPLLSIFIDKLITELSAGNVTEAILLAPQSSESKWFQKLAPTAAAMCFIAGRTKFVSPSGEVGSFPVFGHIFFYFGKNADRFVEVFSTVGQCVRL